MTAFHTPSFLRQTGRHLFDNREIIVLLATFIASSLTVSAPSRAIAQSAPAGVIELAPSEVQWRPRPGPVQGLEQSDLLGAQDKAGPYVVRHKFPTGFKAQPHTHPDTKQYTIISGTWCIGYGETFDSTKLKCLPAGSFYTEPANTPHFVEVRDAVVIQVSGVGPSGTAAVHFAK